MQNLKAKNNWCCHLESFDYAQDKLLRKVFLICLVSLLTSCNTKTFDTEKQLLDYITDEENGYIQKKSVNGYDFSLLYKPTDLLVNQELSDDEKSDSKRIKELRDKYSKYMYFNLSMSKNNQELLSTVPKDRNEFGAMVNQLAFNMNRKVHLFTQSKDTIELADFIYPRMYGMSQSTTIMFVYPNDKVVTEQSQNDEYLNFTIRDIGLYTGEIKFKIPTENIKKQPKFSF